MINTLINELVTYGVRTGLVAPADQVYVTNQLLELFDRMEYTLEEIFEKNLLLLIPFYIFSHETRFDEYEKHKTKLKTLQEDYEQIKNKLEELLNQGVISE